MRPFSAGVAHIQEHRRRSASATASPMSAYSCCHGDISLRACARPRPSTAGARRRAHDDRMRFDALVQSARDVIGQVTMAARFRRDARPLPRPLDKML